MDQKLKDVFPPISENDKSDNGKHQFIKNNHYFTLCIYIFLLIVVSAIAVKAIFSIDQTKAFFAGVFRAISPFLIALLIAYILDPFVRAVYRLSERIFPKLPHRPRLVLSMLVVYLIALGLIIALLIYVLPQVVNNLMDLISYIPAAYTQLIDLFGSLQARFPEVDFTAITDMLQRTQADVVSSLETVTTMVIPALYTASVSIVSWIANFLIAIVVSIYMLYGRISLKRMGKIFLYAMIPEKHMPIVREIVLDCNRIFSKFVVSKMLDSLIIGILCAILMTILRMPYVFLISLVVGITNMIPYFGPFIGAVPGIIIIMVSNPFKALIFMVMILCLQQFDGLYLGPKLMGNSTGMKPLWIIFAITIGGKFFGVLGMFLGVPVFAILGYLAERYMSHRLHNKQINIEEIQ